MGRSRYAKPILVLSLLGASWVGAAVAEVSTAPGVVPEGAEALTRLVLFEGFYRPT